jgi:hypothetical protein
VVSFGFHHQFNLIQGSVLASNGFSTLPISLLSLASITTEPTKDWWLMRGLCECCRFLKYQIRFIIGVIIRKKIQLKKKLKLQ